MRIHSLHIVHIIFILSFFVVLPKGKKHNKKHGKRRKTPSFQSSTALSMVFFFRRGHWQCENAAGRGPFVGRLFTGLGLVSLKDLKRPCHCPYKSMIDWYIYRIFYLQIGCFCSIFMVNYIVGKYIPVTWSYGLLQVTNPTF